MVAGLIPDGKKGAAIVVVDANGVGIGMAMKHGNHIVIDASLTQRWAKGKAHGADSREGDLVTADTIVNALLVLTAAVAFAFGFLFGRSRRKR